MESNAVHITPASAPDLLARPRPFEPGPASNRRDVRPMRIPRRRLRRSLRWPTLRGVLWTAERLDAHRTALKAPRLLRTAGSERNNVRREFGLRFLPLVQQFKRQLELIQ